jgi:hypothetical protein
MVGATCPKQQEYTSRMNHICMSPNSNTRPSPDVDV